MPAAPKFSFGSKPKKHTDVDESLPGPGSYFEHNSVQGKRNPPKFSFGAATRKEMEGVRVPGPGAYTPRSVFASTGGFSCTPRRKPPEISIHEKKPGPGAHNVPANMGTHGPRHSITPRRKANVDAAEKQRIAPGPGAYEPADVVLSQTTQPKWGFGTSPRLPKMPKRNAFNDGKTPGPGAYRHNTEMEGRGPKWSMRPKWNTDKVGLLQED